MSERFMRGMRKLLINLLHGSIRPIVSDKKHPSHVTLFAFFILAWVLGVAYGVAYVIKHRLVPVALLALAQNLHTVV